ncbi:chemotaxis protein CheD [Paenibacillus protaetiae]|uniref:Probable chemoreceptor glutamine deamidase CheD n=1 Tax=Paenibacillus protaetiae TaxID=2509456 RepID=A0A4P6F5E0_9BACL|nr:chemotaxis protein CheD [Paenibacillus protaetiae]QAY65618.1 chemotaxis protein CheD [Paenibacillus protaetiae]
MMMQQHLVKVGMADLNIAWEGAILRTTGLGSCVGLTLYDPVKKIAGMAHIMLPSSDIARETAFNKAKYADTALPELIERMKEAGACPSRLQAKMAGGAQMFAFAGQADAMRIGLRNAESCSRMLEAWSIPVVGQDTGGNYGRTIEIDSSNGVLAIRSVPFGTKEI